MNGVIFYHEAGSCGDFVCGLLQKTKEFFCYSKFDQIDENGMVLPHKAKDNISTLFPEPNRELGLWAARDWIDYDQSKIDALIEKENKIFIINIMTMTQYKSLREKNCNYPLVGINVEGQLDYFVKKCVLLKLKDFESWKDSAKQYGHVAEYMYSKGKFKNWYWKHYLQDSEKYPIRDLDLIKEDEFDYTIDLGNILTFDFTQLSSLVNINKFDKQWMEQWRNKQQKRFIRRPILNDVIENILGYNPCMEQEDYKCLLDEYDNDMIKRYYPNAPYFNNSIEINSYLFR